MELKGKTALVTGASRGIGRAIALKFSQQGMARLLLVARNTKTLESVKTEIHQLAPQTEVITISLDLTQTTAIKRLVPPAIAEYGPVHILVNNAGVAHQANFLNSTLENFEAEINLNLRGTFAITRLLARHMVTQQSGMIVNVSSLMGKLAAPSYSTYSATKFALLGLTQSLRMELASHNVQVVALLPSLTDTDMAQGSSKFGLAIPSSPEEVAQGLVQGLRSGKNEILVGWQSKLAILVSYISPWLIEWIIKLSEKIGHRETRQSKCEIKYQDCCSAASKSSSPNSDSSAEVMNSP